MRIAFITYEYPPDTGKGGIGTYTFQIASMLVSKRWDVHVFAGSLTRQCFTQEKGLNVHRIRCTNPFDFRLKVVSVFQLEHTKSSFDLMESPEIHGNAWEIKKAFPLLPLVIRLHAPNILVEDLKKKYVPFLSKLRYFLGALKRFKWDLGYWRIYNRKMDPDFQFSLLADSITAPSNAIKLWVIDRWQIPHQQIALIPNLFFPPTTFLSIPISENADTRTITFFGRLNVLKGLVNATRALELILGEYPDWKFKVIGDDGPGPFGAITMKQWMQEKLNASLNRVSFYEGIQYHELPSLIAESAIVILPSLFESFSYTCLEAMAAGKPVVGSDNAGMTEIIQDGKNGLLVNPEKYREIYKAVKRLIEDPSLRYHISIQAREMARSTFTDKIAAVAMNHYNHMCRNKV